MRWRQFRSMLLNFPFKYFKHVLIIIKKDWYIYIYKLHHLNIHCLFKYFNHVLCHILWLYNVHLHWNINLIGWNPFNSSSFYVIVLRQILNFPSAIPMLVRQIPMFIPKAPVFIPKITTVPKEILIFHSKISFSNRRSSVASWSVNVTKRAGIGPRRRWRDWRRWPCRDRGRQRRDDGPRGRNGQKKWWFETTSVGKFCVFFQIEEWSALLGRNSCKWLGMIYIYILQLLCSRFIVLWCTLNGHYCGAGI